MIFGAFFSVSLFSKINNPLYAKCGHSIHLQTSGESLKELVAKFNDLSLPRTDRIRAAEQAKAMARTSRDMTIQLEAVLLLAGFNVGHDNQLVAELLAEAEQLLKHTSLATAELSILTIRANLAAKQGEHIEAVKQFREAFVLAVRRDDTRRQAVIQHHIAHSLRELETYNEALNCYHRAIKNFKRCKFHSFEPGLKQAIAEVLYESGQYNEAITIYEELLNLTNNVDRQKLTIGIGQALWMRNFGNDRQRSFQLMTALVENLESNTPGELKAKINCFIGRCHAANKDWELAREYCQRSKRLSKSEPGQSICMLLKAEIDANTGNEDQALASLKELLAVADSSGDANLEFKIVEQMVSTYESLGLHKSALEQSKTLRWLKQDIDDLRSERRLALAESRHKMETSIEALAFEAAHAKTAESLSKSQAEQLASKAELAIKEAQSSRRLRNFAMTTAGLLAAVFAWIGYADFKRRRTVLSLQATDEQQPLSEKLERNEIPVPVGHLASNVVHDVNNVLQVITHNQFLLRESFGAQITEEQILLLSSTEESARVGTRIASQLLDLSNLPHSHDASRSATPNTNPNPSPNTVPKTIGANTYEQLSKPEQPIQLEKLNCLIVEDNESVRESLQLMLSLGSVQSSTANDAQMAAQLLSAKNEFNVVLSDICMPGKMDGVGLANWIRKHQPHVAIVLLSGNPDAQVADDFVFLQKPYGFSDLLSAIELAQKEIYP